MAKGDADVSKGEKDTDILKKRGVMAQTIRGVEPVREPTTPEEVLRQYGGLEEILKGDAKDRPFENPKWPLLNKVKKFLLER